MRYLTATLAIALLSTATATARADHRLEAIAHDYHESVHILADYIAHDRHSSHYLSRYVSRLDDVSHDFYEALVHDPYRSRTRGLFDDVRSLHYRVRSLLGHGCRALPGAAAVWHDADRLYSRLSHAFSDNHHGHHHHPHRVGRVILPPTTVPYPQKRVEIRVEVPRSQGKPNHRDRFDSRGPSNNRDRGDARGPSNDRDRNRGDAGKPRYNLDRERSERKENESRKPNQRPSTSLRSDVTNDAVGRLLTSLFN
ncbi:hypothetical protein [Rosistilla oblonga]|uniref:Uncharacterized protein n=1 Tax=Rosistilla oblonga TaxID=2527990 RepID=A0A518IWH1_9BACT|nr:hypothetical protein [Rosistilla oblonga]QDV57441.1 hypothetical protein Mal33_34510 [Rosistilla oblonga]